MGCGKSKHDVVSGNTVLQSKKSSVNTKVGEENGTETKDKNNNNNNNAENVSSGVEVEQKESENVKEFVVEGKDDEGVKGEAEKTNVEEEKEAGDEAEGKTQETIAVEGMSEKSEGGKDDSLKENDQKVFDGAAEEKKPAENEKEEVIVKEESLANEEEEKIKGTNVSTSKGEEKDLKAEEGK
ncbi:uncharacterized protein LOC133316590 [Gastrolobium bilobum]|uniref:uncharacterized protein LOC133316590 n=1 Tax=Gastrolobium bilobum TaxID=150636 RepID=UPI002AAFF111|nr:uncharacterized protein LOC133316590 [Gastrolobium bilobum]